MEDLKQEELINVEYVPTDLIEQDIKMESDKVLENSGEIGKSTSTISEEEINNSVQTKKIVLENKSTGVAPYIEVPDISLEKNDNQTKFVSVLDLFNSIVLSIVIVYVFSIFKTKKFNNLINRVKNFSLKNSFYIIIVNFILSVIAFLYSSILSIGISGQLPFVINLSFSFLMFLTCCLLIINIVKNLKAINNNFNNTIYSFSGIKFFFMTNIVLILASILLFLFTESSIALICISVFSTSLSFIFSMTKKYDYFLYYSNLFLSLIFFQILLLGIISNVLILIFISSIFTGYFLQEHKSLLNKS